MTTTENQNQTNVLYLIFKVADNHYATLAENILEITRLHKLTVFEKMDKNLVGLMEFRDKIINVLNIKTILGINTENTTKSYGSSDWIIRKTGEGTVDWTDGVFKVAYENNAYDYVQLPNDSKTYTIEEFQNMFLMN